jgi:hypothetical protein
MGRVPAWIVVVIAFVAAVGGWSAYVVAHPSPLYDYFWEFSHNFGSQKPLEPAALFHRVLNNSTYYFRQAPLETLPFLKTWPPVMWFGAGLWWVLLTVGAAKALTKGETAEALYVVFTISMVLAWPEYMDFRFFYPLLPLFLLFAYRALSLIPRVRVRPDLRVAVATLAAGVLLLSSAVHVALIVQAQHSPNPYPPKPSPRFGYIIDRPVIDWSQTSYAFRTSPSMSALGDFLILNEIARQILPPDAIIACAEPRDTALILGRSAIMLPWFDDPASFLPYLASWNVSHLIVDNFSGDTFRFIIPLINAHPECFTKIAGAPDHPAPAIYRFEPPKSTSLPPP